MRSFLTTMAVMFVFGNCFAGMFLAFLGAAMAWAPYAWPVFLMASNSIAVVVYYNAENWRLRMTARAMLVLGGIFLLITLAASIEVGFTPWYQQLGASTIVMFVLCVTPLILAAFEPPSQMPGWRIKRGICQHCGYSLAGLPGHVCPECGGYNPTKVLVSGRSRR